MFVPYTMPLITALENGGNRVGETVSLLNCVPDCTVVQ